MIVDKEGLRYEQETIGDKSYILTFDKNWNFFGILINGIYNKELTDIILDKFCQDDVSFYITKNFNRELNIKLIDLILDYEKNN